MSDTSQKKRREIMKQKLLTARIRKEMAENTRVSSQADWHMHRELDQLKPAFGHWTPVSLMEQEKYRPDNCQVVFAEVAVKSESAGNQKVPAVAAWFEDEGFVIDTHIDEDEYEVTGWMPLPRPKGGGKWMWEL